MESIQKYPLQVTDAEQEVQMPEAARLLTARRQPDRRDISLWSLGDLARPRRPRFFRVFGTGHAVPAGHSWVATVLDGDYVWHVFERA